MSRIRYDRLPTERANPSTGQLDRLSAAQIARLMNRADRRAVRAVGRAAPALGRAVDLIVRTPRELRRRLAQNHPFFDEIVRRGKVLYDAAHA